MQGDGNEELGDVEALESASDYALCVAIGRWHEKALAEVYRRHGAAVHNLAQRVLRSSDLADEVTQEVFLDLWNRPEQFDVTRGSLRTFLVTRAHGKAVDLIRSEIARRSRAQRSAAATAHAYYDLDYHAWDLVRAEQVKQTIAALPEEERQAIEM